MVRMLLCLTALSIAAFADWPRRLGSGKGVSTDSPPPHPLAYFEVDPCLRPPSDVLAVALGCSWTGKPAPTKDELALRAKTQKDLLEIGKIGDFKIYDLWYSTGGSPGFPAPDVRSVLVKTGPGEYREIDAQELLPLSLCPPSEIVALDNEPALVIKYHDGGQNLHIWTRVLVIEKGGVKEADFSAVAEAVKRLTPPHYSVRTFHEDFASMTYATELYKDDTNETAVGVGDRLRINVAYRFHDGRAIVTSSKYEPYP